MKSETHCNQVPRTLLTVRQFATKHPAFTEQGRRWLIFQAKPRGSSKGPLPANGLETALVRIGRRVLIDEAGFFQWVAGQQACGSD